MAIRITVRATLVCIIICCIAAGALVGCGKKAPPVAPQQTPLTAVTDLKADPVSSLGSVRLTWSHSPENWGAMEYLILRAQTALDQPACPGCPTVYQKMATIPVSRALRQEKHTLDFSQKLMGGFRYTFEVRPIHPSGGQGPGSNPVIIEMP